MKGIETLPGRDELHLHGGSDHCPAMKGIETRPTRPAPVDHLERSDHCPAMKGIETCAAAGRRRHASPEATTAPQ